MQIDQTRAAEQFLSLLSAVILAAQERDEDSTDAAICAGEAYVAGLAAFGAVSTPASPAIHATQPAEVLESRMGNQALASAIDETVKRFNDSRPDVHEAG